jgi:hypothetical protein
MKEPLVVVEFPATRREEVEERFLRACAPLGPMLVKRLQQEEWCFWMPLVADYWEPEMTLEEYYYCPEADSPALILSRWIADFLRAKPGRFAVFENDPARKGDPFISNWKTKIFYVDDRVYSYAASGDSADAVDDAIRFARCASWGIGMVVDSSSSDLPGQITEDDLRRLVSNAVSMISDAFDGCGYVVAEMVDGFSIVPDGTR